MQSTQVEVSNADINTRDDDDFFAQTTKKYEEFMAGPENIYNRYANQQNDQLQLNWQEHPEHLSHYSHGDVGGLGMQSSLASRTGLQIIRPQTASSLPQNSFGNSGIDPRSGALQADRDSHPPTNQHLGSSAQVHGFGAFNQNFSGLAAPATNAIPTQEWEVNPFQGGQPTGYQSARSDAKARSAKPGSDEDFNFAPGHAFEANPPTKEGEWGGM